VNDQATEQKIVFGLVMAAGLFSILALAGWLFDVPALMTLGRGGYPMWPMTAVDISFSFRASARRSCGTAQHRFFSQSPSSLPPASC